MLDKTILQHSKQRKANLAMGWVDYQKAYDMVPHSWIVTTIKIVGVSQKAVKLKQA